MSITSLIPPAQTLANQAGDAAVKPLNFNTADSATLNASPQQLDQTAANAVYQQQKSYLDPQWAQSTKDLQDQLSKQGIPIGSDAYNSAMTNYQSAKNQAYQSAQDSATAQGAASAGQNFNLALAGQQQNIAQQATAQQNPIALMQQLLGASPSTSTQPITQPSSVPISPTDTLGAFGLAQAGKNTAYQGQVAQTNAANQATASGVATAATIAALLL